ncbi:MAG: sugar phosphate isomerase/epimerase [candidate division WS1 bacterium]|jgi:sugar phosphate isomerase/epimerase|nr:sugar phosphate isomerase/epimerase [candidate division WS1 bacterium]
MIKLGLSGRIIETGGPSYQMSTIDFIARAAQAGYQGVELRSGQLHDETPDEEVSSIAGALSANSVACTFANCRSEATPEGLDAVRRMAEIARALASPFLRMSCTDIVWMQQACDIAAEYEVRVVVQIHTNTPLETVEGAIRVAAQVDRPNFGLTYEPANFVLASRDYGQEALEQLGEKLFNVSLQNLKPVEETSGDGIIVHQGRGFTRCMPDDPEGVNFAQVFAALKAVDYSGFATLIEPISPVMDNWELAETYLRLLKPLC